MSVDERLYSFATVTCESPKLLFKKTLGRTEFSLSLKMISKLGGILFRNNVKYFIIFILEME